MDGISTVTAAELIAEIGDIRRFSNADKLARFAGIAPVRFSSGGKGKDQLDRERRDEIFCVPGRPPLGLLRPAGCSKERTALSWSAEAVSVRAGSVGIGLL